MLSLMSDSAVCASTLRGALRYSCNVNVVRGYVDDDVTCNAFDWMRHIIK